MLQKYHEEISILLKNKTYTQQGLQNLNSYDNSIRSLLCNRSLPDIGWNENVIEYFLHQLSLMDNNNFLNHIGVGEREGRIYSNIIYQRYRGLSHGIGRSGDLDEVQPKAAGSSLLYKITNYIILDVLKNCYKLKAIKKTLVVPLCTGMSITLCLLSLKSEFNVSPTEKTKQEEKKYVIWSRIDQKSCFKSILTAGLYPLIVDGIKGQNDEIITNINKIKSLIEEYGENQILCILTTTSCFAPRTPDSIDIISKICFEKNISHIINNAYGLQCPIICHLINRSINIGRVDYIICSTDKNFLVPVGGAIISSPSKKLIDKVSKIYPGRASMSPILDLFVTLLNMGKNAIKILLKERMNLLKIFINSLGEIIKPFKKFNCRLLKSGSNTISISISISTYDANNFVENSVGSTPSFIGAKLFQKCISGTRVVESGIIKNVCGYTFEGWGASINNYDENYITMACPIGLTIDEVKIFIPKLYQILKKYYHHQHYQHERADLSEQAKRVNVDETFFDLENIENIVDNVIQNLCHNNDNNNDDDDAFLPWSMALMNIHEREKNKFLKNID